MRRPVDLPDLDGIEIEPWADGEQLTIVDTPVPRPQWPRVYRGDGTPHPPARNVHEFLAQSAQGWRDAEQFRYHTQFYRSGHSIRVCTDFLKGDDWNTMMPGHPPLLWETMIQVGWHFEEKWQWRYASADAARRGHRLLCQEIRRQNRERNARMFP